MGGKIGKKGWEKIETFIEDAGTWFIKGIRDGMNSDDKKKEEAKNAKVG